MRDTRIMRSSRLAGFARTGRLVLICFAAAGAAFAAAHPAVAAPLDITVGSSNWHKRAIDTLKADKDLRLKFTGPYAFATGSALAQGVPGIASAYKPVTNLVKAALSLPLAVAGGGTVAATAVALGYQAEARYYSKSASPNDDILYLLFEK